MLAEKTHDEINDNVVDAIQLFAVRGRWRLIGSNALRSTQYGVDYDIETHLSQNPAAALQHAFHEALNNPNLYVIELKCGVDPRLWYQGDYSKISIEEFLTNPLISSKTRQTIQRSQGEKQIELVRDLFILRWSAKDVSEGRIRLIDGSYRSLRDCLLDKTTAKVDLILKVGDQFAEISENYYIRADKHTNYDETELKSGNILKSLEEDIHYYSKVNSFKALKRLFSLFKFNPKLHRNEIRELVSFFNGQVGYVNKIKNELAILRTILTNSFRKVPWIDVRNNLQFIKEQISTVYEIPVENHVSHQIDACTPTNVLATIKTLEDYFAAKVNQHSKDFLRSLLYTEKK